MALSYTIGGSGVLDISGGRDNLREQAGIQVVSNAALDASVTLKLQQSNDNTNWHDLPETPLPIDAGAFSNLLITESFYCDFIRLSIDELTATAGELTIITNYKD
jgi:hypothetical protein